MTLVLARRDTSGPRVRLYCEMLPSLLVGVPSKNHNGRPRIPVGPPSLRRSEEVMRCLKAGSRYLSNRSGGSMMCMSQSTNRYPCFIQPPPSKSRTEHRLRKAAGTSLGPGVIFTPVLPPVRRSCVQNIEVLVIQRLGAADRAKIEAVDPAVRLTDAGGWFDGEYRESWPAYTASRYLRSGSVG